MSLRKPIPFVSFFGYRPFTRYWWNDVLSYLTGISCISSVFLKPSLRAPGWWTDVYTFYHRGRYGWAPRDTWNLSDYYNHVFAGSLEYLAEYHHGCPPTYYDATNTGNECHAWDMTVRRWATAFSESPTDVAIFDADDDYVKQDAEETRRRENIHTALKEMEPLWDHLWD